MGVGETLAQPALGLVGGGFAALLGFAAGRFHIAPDARLLRPLPGQLRLVGLLGLVGVVHQPVQTPGLAHRLDPLPAGGQPFVVQQALIHITFRPVRLGEPLAGAIHGSQGVDGTVAQPGHRGRHLGPPHQTGRGIAQRRAAGECHGHQAEQQDRQVGTHNKNND